MATSEKVDNDFIGYHKILTEIEAGENGYGKKISRKVRIFNLKHE